jgi:hypothetical protein
MEEQKDLEKPGEQSDAQTVNTPSLSEDVTSEPQQVLEAPADDSSEGPAPASETLFLPDPKPVVAPQKLFTKKKVLIALAAVIVIGGGGSVALAATFMSSHKTVARTNAALPQKTTAATALTANRTFIRYEKDGAYEKDAKGVVKETVDKDGVHNSVRKKNFTVTVERNGQKHDLTLGDTTQEVGITTKGAIYALSCSVPAVDQVGADNPSFTAQFYDKDGAKLTALSWKRRDANRPVGVGGYCNNTYFNMPQGKPVDFTSSNVSQQPIDSLNYKLLYKGKEVDRETENDIDIPLGLSPDGMTFLYDKVGATRVAAGCGPETTIPYKLPVYDSSNELHSFNLKTGVDTNIGPESAFNSGPQHEINFSKLGVFSSDGSHYYLQEGGHGGCRGGDSHPIRIPYIDLKTNKFETISSPAGKEYSEYCYNDTLPFAVEFGAVDDFNDKTPAKIEAAPSILNLDDGTTFQAADFIAGGVDCFANNNFPGKFVEYDKTQAKVAPNDFLSDVTLTGLRTLDPLKKSVQKLTFDTPIAIAPANLNFVGLTSDNGVGYVNRGIFTDTSSIDTTKVKSSNVPTILFDVKTGKTAEVPYAQLVL